MLLSSGLRSIYPRLIEAAFHCQGAFDFPKVLKLLVEFAGAQGCIVWEIFHAGSAERRYFTLVEHFPRKPEGPRWYFLPQESVTGRAALGGQRVFIPDVAEAMARGEMPQGELLLAHGITAFCAIPVSFGERREAAVNFYWNRSDGVEERLAELEEAAGAIPALLHGVLTKMGFALLREVEQKLNDMPTGQTLTKVLDAVVRSFKALEAAIYLEEQRQAEPVFRLQAKEWPWRTPIAESYRADGSGLTSWILQRGESLRFVDLRDFRRERESEKLGFTEWKGLERFVEQAAERFGPDKIPPLAFLGVPIRDGDRVVGVIRCCVIDGDPHVFDDRHRQILELVAGQIGHWVGNKRAIREAEQEKDRFKKLVEGISSMHGLASRSLRDNQKPDMAHLWDQALEIAADVTPWGDALSIRMVDKERDDLYFVRARGERWSEGGKREYARRLAQRYALSGDSAGAKVIRERKVQTEPEAGMPGRLRSMLFPDATRVIHAPILIGKEAIGVLDIRGFGSDPMPKHIELTCELLCRQLGLYQHLQEQFWKLRESERLLSKQYDEQNQIYEDFLHQLRNPLVKASMLAQRATDPSRRATVDLSQLKNHVRQAFLFADTMNQFVALAKGDRIDAPIEVMKHDAIVQKLKESAADQALVASEMDKPLRFTVDEKSFEPVWTKSVLYSEQLFSHCILNLLDNATKYSRSGTDVQIYGRFDESRNRFAISVSNEGFLIRPDEAKRLVERGVRGDRALKTTAGGRGIGLWIVQQFMQAIKGDLIILPTDSRNRNVFSLAFPSGQPT